MTRLLSAKETVHEKGNALVYFLAHWGKIIVSRIPTGSNGKQKPCQRASRKSLFSFLDGMNKIHLGKIRT